MSKIEGTSQHLLVHQIGGKALLKTFLRWVRKLGEIIQWMISAIQEVPWLIIEPKVSIIPSAWNIIVSGTFLTAESFNSA